MFNSFSIKTNMNNVLDSGMKQLDKAMNDLDQVLKNDPFKWLENPIDKCTNSILSYYGQIPSFPPCNIYSVKDEKSEQDNTTNSETQFVIELALSGYKNEDVSVTIQENDGVEFLIIDSKGINDKRQDVSWYQHGIAGRAFKMTFKIGNNTKVDNAELVDGMLTIKLSTIPKVNTQSTRKIVVNSRKK